MTILIVLLLLIFSAAESRAGDPYQPEVRKIWDGGPHNAFTDLIMFRNSYYCVFREGSGHIPGTDGVIRILRSTDLIKWESVALLKKEGIDLRDAKLSVMPGGRMMIIMGGSIYKEGKILGRIPHVSFSDKKGLEFSVPQKIAINPELVSWGDWIWRVTWHKKTGYGIDYQIGPDERKGPTFLFLVRTRDGRSFEKVSPIELDGFPNEATLRFDRSGKLYALIRRELDDQKGVWATSDAPFTQWEFSKLENRLGGPNFIFTRDEKVIMGSRVHDGKEVFTGIYTGDKAGRFELAMRLPSGGDNSYPGLLLEKKRLIVSYYSSHEGKSAIYLAVIPRNKLPGIR